MLSDLIQGRSARTSMSPLTSCPLHSKSGLDSSLPGISPTLHHHSLKGAEYVFAAKGTEVKFLSQCYWGHNASEATMPLSHGARTWLSLNLPEPEGIPLLYRPLCAHGACWRVFLGMWRNHVATSHLLTLGWIRFELHSLLYHTRSRFSLLGTQKKQKSNVLGW